MSKDSHKNEIFIINSKMVAYAISTSHKIWLKLPGLKGRKHNDSPMRALHRDFSFFAKIKNYKEYLNKEEIKFIEEYSSGWMDKYRDAWHLINK